MVRFSGALLFFFVVSFVVVCLLCGVYVVHLDPCVECALRGLCCAIWAGEVVRRHVLREVIGMLLIGWSGLGLARVCIKQQVPMQIEIA